MTLTMTRKVSECQAETVQFMPIQKLEDDCMQEKEFSSNKLLKRGKKLEDNNNLTKEDVEYINFRKLLKYEEAPEYLQHNPYIRDGYRKLLPTRLCWESVFWWTNETMNIWTHIFGFFLLLFLTINDLVIINIHATVTDKTVAAILFSCFLGSNSPPK
ncbi:jg11840 [Pararge aegeria aegeria]|uniref:Jg11840 protein n=1 Tax=Pararge aegeria aegeria TaxID=348720 RepID=A0A8S4SN32_9NEOP|nr:jg11840 [Pararge aegeria aegeria]